MDPASAIIGIVSFGLTVFAKVNEIRKSIKGAPQQVQALQDTCDTVEMLLGELRSLETHIVPQSENDLASLKRLCERSQRCLEEVDKAVDKVVAENSSRKAGSDVKVKLRKWVLNKDDLEDTSKKLNAVLEALRVMMDFIQFRHVKFVAAHVHIEQNLHFARTVQYRTSTSTTCISSISSRHTGPLECSDNCTCRCHAQSPSPLIPQSLAPYVGQLFISKQLLHPAFTPWNRCNVETCRGTYLKPAKVAYTLPQWSLLYGSFQTSSFGRVHFSLNAYRTVPYSSPIIQAIWRGDVCIVRDMFAKQQASIWDVDIDGSSILWYACEQWQRYPTEDQLEIVRFLVEAGADALFLADTETTSSAHDILALGLFQHLVCEPDPGQSFTATIQNNSAAITVFRSIFNMDALDALKDVLSRYYGYSDEDASRLLTSHEATEATEYAVARSSMFDAIGYAPLQYAIYFSPSNVESLLAEGADAAAEPTLAYAARVGRDELIALLINNGADVNMKYEGRAALHWVCYACYYSTFFELVRCAEDKIDWDVRTPEGQNALDLFDEGLSRGHASATGLSSEEVEQFRSVIISHMDPLRLRVVDDEPLDIPGAFPLDTES